MGFLDKAIFKGIGQAVEIAVTDKVLDAVAPQAKENIAKNTQILNDAAAQLQKTAETYGAEASKNVRICSYCGTGAPARMKFCSECGKPLPEQTLYEQIMSAQSRCSGCQAAVPEGAKFCPECGTAVPPRAALAEPCEWPELSRPFPLWRCGGAVSQEEADGGLHVRVSPASPDDFAMYREEMLAEGFRSRLSAAGGEYLWRVEGDCKYELSCNVFDEGEGQIHMIFKVIE